MRQTLLADCVARSHPLSTVLDPDENTALPADHGTESTIGDWSDVFDSEDAFRERLSLSGHTVASVREQFETGGEEPESIPSAFETAERVVDRAVSPDAGDTEALRDRHEGRAFVHLLAPLVEAGAAGLELEGDFERSAVESLENCLFERLSQVFRHPLFVLFKAYQRTAYPETDFSEATDSTAVYEEFVAEHRETDYERIFETYPVLLRLLGVVTDQWRRSAERLRKRISADRAALERTFNDGTELGPVADVEPLSEDSHGDGEIVFAVRFADDCSVVYKPRSVGAAVAFNRLLGWTNERTEGPDLYAPTVLDRGSYGWMEHLSQQPCERSDQVERYYRRMGELSALGFALGSTDLHHENIVAVGETPVLVDLETILSPRFERPSSASPAVSSFIEGSILDTLLVPFSKHTGADNHELMTSGLSELTNETRETKRPNFRRPNTDAMDITFDKVYHFDGENLPRLDGEVRGVSEYLAPLKRGFRDVMAAVLDHRDELASPDGPLAAFEGTEIRYLVRPTGAYASLLAERRYASRLRSGVRQSLTMESLYEQFVSDAENPGLSDLVTCEKAALLDGIVPRFTAEATGRELRDGRGNPQGVFTDDSPVEHASRRISSLDAHQVETQLRLIDLTLTDSQVSDPVSPPSEGPSRSVSDADSPREFVSAIADLLDETATRYSDGSLRWAEFARSSPTDHVLPREPGLGLYEGYAGVGVFLAAAAAVYDDDRLAERSRRVLQSVREAFENETDRAETLRIGGVTGTGSVAYALVTAGELLGDAGLVESAREVANRTSADEIAEDVALDVMGGSAGELLAQLAVYERTGDRGALRRARWCGDRLLEATSETSAGFQVPTSEETETRFAFAHGAGGIGYALSKLGGVTDDEAYARVGRDALRFDTYLWQRESDADDEGTGESGSHTGTVWGWCNGTAGVGTSRVGVADAGMQSVGDFSVLRESLRPELSQEDSLCCGSAGRALFLLDAGDVLEDESLTERGEELFENTLDRAEREGRFRLANHLPLLPKFGLFTGLTGLGYVALSLDARERDCEIPNVTRLE
ncbi:type 2 lanthipeptide synthetase LanM [Halorussus amylolyticus]|uniref:type 2 lanthipeptide synthetase LanM n=1 Tax=Halorussus amylolyticus TaxID=1126242 RepID=UPI0010480C51|nr:type 2 lanthipeptide synthetase LanM [Halorussus amylolyticus]